MPADAAGAAEASVAHGGWAPGCPSPDLGPAPAGTGDLLGLPAPDLAEHLRASRARLLVIGRTRDGRAFRPSDWAERLAGVLAPYRPAGPGRTRAQAHLGYSPLAVPTERQGQRCVIVDPALRQVEPLAWAFVLNFARDNGLETAIC